MDPTTPLLPSRCPPSPVPAARRARRTRRQGWQGSEGWHSLAVLSARAGGVSGDRAGAPRRQRGGLSVLSATGERGENGGGRAPGIPRTGEPRAPGRGGDPPDPPVPPPPAPGTGSSLLAARARPRAPEGGGAPLGGDTHRWPGTPASERTAISSPRPRSFPPPFSLPPPGAPVLTKLAETRRRGTAAPAGGTGSSSSSSSTAVAPSRGSPMAESCSPRCRCSVPGARCPPRAGPAAFLRWHVRPRPVRAAATCFRQRFLRRPPRGAHTRGKAASLEAGGGFISVPGHSGGGERGCRAHGGRASTGGPRALVVSPGSWLGPRRWSRGVGEELPPVGATPQHPRVGAELVWARSPPPQKKKTLQFSGARWSPLTSSFSPACW